MRSIYTKTLKLTLTSNVTFIPWLNIQMNSQRRKHWRLRRQVTRMSGGDEIRKPENSLQLSYFFFMSSAKIISSCEHESQIHTHSIGSWLWHVSLNEVISLIFWTFNFISPFNCLFHNAPYPVLNHTLCKICTQKTVRVIFNLEELYRLFGLYSFQ